MKVANKIFTLLCDDIRDEIGSKTSLMGIYSKDIVFNKIPAILPRLCLAIFVEKIKEPFKNIKVVLKSPESEDIILNAAGQQSTKKDDNISAFLFVSPFRAKAAGNAKFDIYFGNAKKPALSHHFEIKEREKK